MQRSQNLQLERLRQKNKGQNKQTQFLFGECAKRIEKESQILTTHKTFMKKHIVQQTKHQLRPDVSGRIVFELQGMEPLIDEYKLQVDEKNKN